MKRANSVTDALNTGNALLDFGDNLPKVAIPLDGDFGGEPGPPGAGVPTGGSALQVIRKNAANTTTEWADVNKSLVGLNNVDNTSDVNKPVSNATQTALGGKADKAELNNKADLVGGKIPVAQLPATGIVTDSSVAAQVNSPETGAEIDGRITTQATPLVQPIVADYIASSQVVVDAAAAAVDANPKIAELEAAKWARSVVPAGTDFDTIKTLGSHPVSQTNHPNQPFPVAGDLSVTPTGSGSTFTQEYTTRETVPRKATRITSVSGWWPWNYEGWVKDQLPGGTDFNTVKTPGSYPVYGTNHPNQPFPVAGTLDVLPSGSGSTFTHIYKTREQTPRTAERITSVDGWWPWSYQEASRDIGIHQHQARLSDMRRRAGVVSTGGKGAVTLIFDHGTNNFATEVLPLLTARNMRATLALNADMYNPLAPRYPYDNATTWAQIKGWHDSDGIEIANHGDTHKDASGLAALDTEIVGSRERLEAELGITIDSWVQPGISGTEGYGGFNNGATLASYWETDAGRMILDSHAVVTGLVPGPILYPLDGDPTIGMFGEWIDRPTGIDTVKAGITAAGANGQGYIVRCHPELLNQTGYSTTADIVAFLDWLAGRTDVEVLQLREFAIAHR